jgi:hypothetical protein
MSKQFTHLVWLGAGTAHEPKGLLATADYVTLVDTRESACTLLAPLGSENVSVKQLLLTSDGVDHEFTEYNLVEFSSIQPIDGLKTLFPGIKAVKSEPIKSTKITSFIKGLQLNDQNNLLVVDIPDINLMLLNALHESGLLNNFCEIYIQTSRIPLYANAATHKEINEFLEKHGYILNNTTGTDPDLPWLYFIVNPLWSTLQLTLSSKQALHQELEHTKQQLDKSTAQYLSAVEEYRLQIQKQESERTCALASKDEEIALLNQKLGQVNSQLSTLQLQIKELSSANEQLDNRIQEQKLELSEKSQQFYNADQQQQMLIEKLCNEVQQAQTQAASRLETIAQLEKNNRSLHQANGNLHEQQKSVKHELLKTEAQIDLIKHLFLKN